MTKPLDPKDIVSDRTVRRWIDDGELRSHHLGRLVRVSEEDWADFLARRRRP
jgi:excisionase family DNA binding protein